MSNVRSQSRDISIMEQDTLVSVFTQVSIRRRELSEEERLEEERIWTRDNRNYSEKAQILQEPNPLLRNALWMQYVCFRTGEDWYKEGEYKKAQQEYIKSIQWWDIAKDILRREVTPKVQA